MLPPESAPPEVVSREIGVGVSTLEKWRSQSLGKPARDKTWTAAGTRLSLVAAVLSIAVDSELRLWAPC